MLNYLPNIFHEDAESIQNCCIVQRRNIIDTGGFELCNLWPYYHFQGGEKNMAISREFTTNHSCVAKNVCWYVSRVKCIGSYIDSFFLYEQRKHGNHE